MGEVTADTVRLDPGVDVKKETVLSAALAFIPLARDKLTLRRRYLPLDPGDQREVTVFAMDVQPRTIAPGNIVSLLPMHLWRK